MPSQHQRILPPKRDIPEGLTKVLEEKANKWLKPWCCLEDNKAQSLTEIARDKPQIFVSIGTPRKHISAQIQLPANPCPHFTFVSFLNLALFFKLFLNSKKRQIPPFKIQQT